jgi:hypothetical protein
MAFFIKVHPHTVARRVEIGIPSEEADYGYADNRDIRMYLGLKSNKKLPLDYENRLLVPLKDGRTVELLVLKGHKSTVGMRGKSSKHRCFAKCPDCMQYVPAGRAHMHKCKR